MKKTLIALLLILGGCQKPCPNASFFTIAELSGYTFADAETACQTEQGHLAVFDEARKLEMEELCQDANNQLQRGCWLADGQAIFGTVLATYEPQTHFYALCQVP